MTKPDNQTPDLEAIECALANGAKVFYIDRLADYSTTKIKGELGAR